MWFSLAAHACEDPTVLAALRDPGPGMPDTMWIGSDGQDMAAHGRDMLPRLLSAALRLPVLPRLLWWRTSLSGHVAAQKHAAQSTFHKCQQAMPAAAEDVTEATAGNRY
eukprot:jgi/Tetstr1/436353/TSEL_025189.t1